MSKRFSKKRLVAIQEELLFSMREEVKWMRELLGNMKEEQHALIEQNIGLLNSVLQSRNKLLEMVMQLRSQRMAWVEQLHHHGIKKAKKTSSIDWEHLLDVTGQSCSELLVVKEQLVALADQMKRQNETNQYLVDHRIQHAKKMMDRLHRAHDPSIYTPHGLLKPKTQVKTMTINFFNQEG